MRAHEAKELLQPLDRERLVRGTLHALHQAHEPVQHRRRGLGARLEPALGEDPREHVARGLEPAILLLGERGLILHAQLVAVRNRLGYERVLLCRIVPHDLEREVDVVQARKLAEECRAQRLEDVRVVPHGGRAFLGARNALERPVGLGLGDRLVRDGLHAHVHGKTIVRRGEGGRAVLGGLDLEPGHRRTAVRGQELLHFDLERLGHVLRTVVSTAALRILHGLELDLHAHVEREVATVVLVDEDVTEGHEPVRRAIRLRDRSDPDEAVAVPYARDLTHVSDVTHDAPQQTGEHSSQQKTWKERSRPFHRFRAPSTDAQNHGKEAI